MSTTLASAASFGGGGQIAAGSPLRVYQQQQQQGSPYDVNSGDPSSTRPDNNRAVIPQTHKKECGMTFCGERRKAGRKAESERETLQQTAVGRERERE